MSAVPTQYPEPDESFFVFRSKQFFFNISISGDRTGERKVSAVPKQYPEPDKSIFVFRSKQFLFHISISGVSTGERKVSAVLYAVPRTGFVHFYFSVQKIFLPYLNFWRSHR